MVDGFQRGERRETVSKKREGAGEERDRFERGDSSVVRRGETSFEVFEIKGPIGKMKFGRTKKFLGTKFFDSLQVLELTVCSSCAEEWPLVCVHIYEQGSSKLEA